jgi:hypothetical protein
MIILYTTSSTVKNLEFSQNEYFLVSTLYQDKEHYISCKSLAELPSQVMCGVFLLVTDFYILLRSVSLFKGLTHVSYIHKITKTKIPNINIHNLYIILNCNLTTQYCQALTIMATRITVVCWKLKIRLKREVTDHYKITYLRIIAIAIPTVSQFYTLGLCN